MNSMNHAGEPETHQSESAKSRFLKDLAGHSPKISISAATRIGSSGSRFAEEIVRSFRQLEFIIMNEEPVPPGLAQSNGRRFGYGLHSARHGDICTARQLRQLAEEAVGQFKPAGEIWRKGERYFDALRPSVEPNGLSTAEVVADHRLFHLNRFKRVLEKCEVFSFTLDRIEAWEHEPSGTVYPVAPGVIAGALDPTVHRHRKFTCQEICDDLASFFALCKSFNPEIRFLLSISPEYPSDTDPQQEAQNKSILRAVVDQFCRERADIDYLPVYELVVRNRGNVQIADASEVQAMVDELLQQYVRQQPSSAEMRVVTVEEDDDELERMLGGDALCEEILNETFKP